MPVKSELFIDGITCAHCAKGIEKHLLGLGLSDVQVNIASKSASFTESLSVPTSDVVKSLNTLGYSVNRQRISEKRFLGLSYLNFITILCCILTVPLMMMDFVSSGWLADILHDSYVQLAISIPVMLTGGIYFLKSAVRSLKLKAPNMDCLIALGSWSAFFYSLSGTLLNLGHKFMFYETSVSIIAIVLVGNLIEERAVAKTEKSILNLQKFRPETVKRQTTDGKTEHIAVDQLKTEDLIILSPGDRVPCDGTIIEGSVEADLSFLSGEALPKNIIKGGILSCGTLIVGGNCLLKAEKTGEDSSLVQIIRQIQASRSAKPALEKLADKVTSVFVPVVLAISVLTFVLNYLFGISAADSMIRAIAVLVISCPCALGLATPTAVTVALGLASKNGILLRKASVFESLEKIRHFIFDKTGTLTDGNFKIQEFATDGIDPDQAKAIIMALEAYSHHPIARALRDYCADSSYPAPILSDHNEKRAFGISASTADGYSYELSSRDISLPYNLALRRNDQIVARIILSDQIKADAARLIEDLRTESISAEILSGDRHSKTSLVAESLKISEFRAELLPENKAEIVAETADRIKTAFVGDGINDSAALARAHVGITFSEASDLARQSADVVIISGGLNKISELRQLAVKTTQSIKQNLFWAFFYNIIMIPIAALGFLSPMHAALAMVLSDLIVVANSLRLKLWKPL